MSGIYEPREDSELLARVVRELATGACLDMGTGTGVQAFAALENNTVTSVLAVDKNEQAIAHVQTRIMNLPQSQRGRITTLVSDRYAHVPDDMTFDTIICNPPYLPDVPDDEDPALYGGPGGYEWIVAFLDESIAHLAPGGQILLLFSSLSNKERIDAHLKRQRLLATEVAQLAMFFERLYVYRITRP